MGQIDMSDTQSDSVCSVSPRPIIVVKIGTSTLMRDHNNADTTTISSAAGKGLRSGSGELAVSSIGLLVDTLLTLRRDGYDVILVTSGAVGVGCRELGVSKRPKVQDATSQEERARILADIQAYAAVGQSVLMRTYDALMGMANQKVAQILLTSGDLSSEYQYINAKNTLSSLLRMGVIPIVNENDTTATEELKYGDNDWLSALVSTSVGAEWLFLLTDVDQLYTANPRVDKSAKPINVVPNIESLQVNLSSNTTGTQWGTGGMKTKITAARLATAAGVRVCLIHGRFPSRAVDFVRDTENKRGTVFEPLGNPLNIERKKWISNCLPPRGKITINQAAESMLRIGYSLRTNGVIHCARDFDENSAVTICTESGMELARGMCNYSSQFLKKYGGRSGQEISKILCFPVNDVVVHGDNLALLVDNCEQH
eukprot:TRINITY_DN78538_c0_g1_i1.p1 TRINITY_DN78538_c0_g1~~TRINITY_DN78538_c0_g1_i1.p1  ORF type:complete len:427 (-),score=42.82 TRINITY_DN78538_c0_g1_i1:631-1911(-)